MKQRSEVAADRAASYLREMGIRPSSKAYQYLLFALTQLQCGTPFQNSIWGANGDPLRTKAGKCAGVRAA